MRRELCPVRSPQSTDFLLKSLLISGTRLQPRWCQRGIKRKKKAFVWRAVASKPRRASPALNLYTIILLRVSFRAFRLNSRLFFRREICAQNSSEHFLTKKLKLQWNEQWAPSKVRTTFRNITFHIRHVKIIILEQPAVTETATKQFKQPTFVLFQQITFYYNNTPQMQRLPTTF